MSHKKYCKTSKINVLQKMSTSDFNGVTNFLRLKFRLNGPCQRLRIKIHQIIIYQSKKISQLYPHTFAESHGCKAVDGCDYSLVQARNRQNHTCKGVEVYRFTEFFRQAIKTTN
jgi:hypothetical protein